MVYGGHISNLSGDMTGIKGCATNIRGNLDDCNITEEERAKGIDIKDLIGGLKITNNISTSRLQQLTFII